MTGIGSRSASQSDFLDWLAELRKVNTGLTLKELGRLLCVAESTVHRWQTGEMECPDSTLQQLAGLYLMMALDTGLPNLASDGHLRAFTARVAQVVSDPSGHASQARFERAWANGKRPGAWTGAKESEPTRLTRDASGK